MADEKKRDDDFVIDVGDRKGRYDSPPRRSPPPPSAPLAATANNPIFPVISYCGSSILMTVTNKYVLSGTGFNLNIFLLFIQVCDSRSDSKDFKPLTKSQSIVCVIAIQSCKTAGIITYRDFNQEEARKCILNSVNL